jgi:hypothetical protein
MFVAGPALLFTLLAAAPTARLQYEVRPELSRCPDARWVRSAVASRLGRDPFAEDAKTLVRARIEPTPGPGLTALIEVERADGTTGRRTLESPLGDCLELASAVELAITLAIEPRWLPKAPASPEPVTLVPSGRLGLLATAGGVPGFTGGLLLGGGVAWARFSLSLEGRALWPTGVVFGSSRAQTFSALASVLPCLRLGPVDACAVVTVGALQVDSPSAEVRRVTTVMAQAGARVSAGLRVSPRLALVPWLEGQLVLTRTSLISAGSTLWVTWPVAVSGGLSLQLEFSS